ncbi:MAG: DUF4157 domain-containing protein [Paludibacteraceae bacterium]|nr:DUF4157 domain-containing protein [Paludibacteraceae bacterium]
MADTVVNGGTIRREISNGSSGGGIAVSAAVESQLAQAKGGGRAMPDGLRNMMESGFGRDFSNVKIHTDSQAEAMNNSLSAKAFTLGNDIYFNKGQFSPNTREGQHLMAHELTHVVQGSGKVGRDGFDFGHNGLTLESKELSKEELCSGKHTIYEKKNIQINDQYIHSITKYILIKTINLLDNKDLNEEIKKSFNFRKTKGKELDNIRQQLKENYKTITAKYRDNNTSIIFVDNKTKVAGGWVCKLPENYKIPVRYENKKETDFLEQKDTDHTVFILNKKQKLPIYKENANEEQRKTNEEIKTNYAKEYALTIIHELSHLYLSTKDYIYFHKNAPDEHGGDYKKGSPVNYMKNADSYRKFCELLIDNNRINLNRL